MPEPIRQFNENNVGAQMFPAGSFRRGALSLCVGRWKPTRKSKELGTFIPVEEIGDLEVVMKQVTEYLTSMQESRAGRQ